MNERDTKAQREAQGTKDGNDERRKERRSADGADCTDYGDDDSDNNGISTADGRG